MRINLLTGTAWTKSIIVDGDEKSDILQLIDDYYEEHKDLPVAMYTMDQLDEDELNTYIPINGGEFWIEGIASIDFDDSIINEEPKVVKEDFGMSTDYIELGSAPYEEDCVQVSRTKDYIEDMSKECKQYKEMLMKRFPIPDAIHAWFNIKGFEHDYGTYYEVVIKYNEEASDFANFVENNLPATWNDKEVLEFVEEPEVIDEGFLAKCTFINEKANEILPERQLVGINVGAIVEVDGNMIYTKDEAIFIGNGVNNIEDLNEYYEGLVKFELVIDEKISIKTEKRFK